MKKFCVLLISILCFCSFSFAQENKSLTILEIPKPTIPEIVRSVSIQGFVVLRVEFLADGKVGEVSPVTTLGYGLTESAIEAAKKIKFEPAIQNGESKTIFKALQYSFTWHSGWKVPLINTTYKKPIT